MKQFFGFILVLTLTCSGLWIAEHETVSQELLTAVMLIVISIIIIALSLKTLSSER